MFNNIKRIYWILVFGLFAASCKKSAPGPIVYDASKQQNIMNVAYGSDPAQTMDVYLPPGRSTSTTKVIVMVHGGSWDGGDKTDFNSAVVTLEAKLPGYAFFNINYRLAAGNKNNYPAAVNDVASAVAYINTRSADFDVTTQKLVLAGASAGAHLAMLEAYNNNASGNVKAVVDLFGPVDLHWLFFDYPFPQLSQPVLINFMGVSAVGDSSLYAQASPINYISATSPPTIIFHGTSDDIVPIDESVRLQAKLQSFNVPNSFIIYQGEGHGWTDANLSDTYNKIADFLNQYVN